jgi:hypothetical protein
LRQAQAAGIYSEYTGRDVNIKDYNGDRTSKNVANYKTAYADLQPGKVISLNGNMYQVLEVGVAQNEEGNEFLGMSDSFKRIYTKAKNLTTGKEEYILRSGRFSA